MVGVGHWPHSFSPCGAGGGGQGVLGGVGGVGGGVGRGQGSWAIK
jgi:hypothetical protein